MVASLVVQTNIQQGTPVPWQDITCLLWHNDRLFSALHSSFSNTTGYNGKIFVWDKDLNAQGEFQAHPYPIYHMCSGPDSTFYSSASDSIICHWQCPSKPISSLKSEPVPEVVSEYTLLSSLEGHLEPPCRLQFFNNRLFSGDSLGEIRLWENDSYKGVMETYEEIWDMIVINKFIFTVRFTDVTITSVPSGEKKACSVKNTLRGRGPLFVSRNRIIFQNRDSFDIMIHLISEVQNPLVTVLSGHKALITTFVGNEDLMFSGDYEGRVIAWDLQELKMITDISLNGNGCVNAMAFSPEEKAIYTAQENKVITKIRLT
ncbi:Katanin p80 WD40 repeat-containing subunit B1 [Orchesella cincta]|uniref:Katanin p80 WD40 repeat-containing subunit B1 n=1 Tax=Orchesella cincta TaxID=48709 RepID=A0A1D2NFS9_ORCCI|nr:Katanin p80 WD40 repeat-containing subunit B1 [Orchesella cincta]